MITRKNKAFFMFGFLILATMIVVSFYVLYNPVDETNLAQLSIATTIGTMTALALALIAIGYSIREADIIIILGDKSVTSSGVLQEIRVSNIGNALGNLAHTIVEIEVPQSNPVSFKGAEGLEFEQTLNQSKKQYRLDSPENPKDLYPAGKDDFNLLGFIHVPKGIKDDITLSVKIVGSQGSTRQKFTFKRRGPGGWRG